MSYAPQLQLEFFTGLVDRMRELDLPFGPPRPAARHWVDLPLGTGLGHIALCALGDGRIRCEFYSDHPRASLIYEKLAAERAAIERELGRRLDWQPLPGRKAIRIAVHNDIGNLANRERWPAAYEWLLDWAVKFKIAFDRRVKDVALPGSD